MRRFAFLVGILVTFFAQSQTCTLTVSKNPACVGDTIWLKASGSFSATTLTFGGPSIYTVTPIDSIKIIISSVSFGGVYSCTLSNSTTTCVTSLNLIVDNISVISSASGTTICQNSNAILNATGGSNYNWTGPNSFSSTFQNPMLFNIQLVAAGIYSVIITSTNNCSTTKTVNLIVNSGPTVQITASDTVCLNSIISLSATGGVFYQWTGQVVFSHRNKVQLLLHLV